VKATGAGKDREDGRDAVDEYHRRRHAVEAVTGLKRALRRALERRGWELRRRHDVGQADLEPEFLELHARCAAYTMTSVERMYALYGAIHHVIRAGIPGELVECGVWRGGSSMMAALVLMQLGDSERRLYLYDTFAGMPEPGELDIDARGQSAHPTWQTAQRQDINEWCYSSLTEVRENLLSTGLPTERLHLVEGLVEETIPATAPERIAVLRLDTDWYESTRHELEHLYPRLSPGGVLIIDDYGHWAGARAAVDRYFAKSVKPPLLHRIDNTGRIGVRVE
jgi:O-methyltransferase